MIAVNMGNEDPVNAVKGNALGHNLGHHTVGNFRVCPKSIGIERIEHNLGIALHDQYGLIGHIRGIGVGIMGKRRRCR